MSTGNGPTKPRGIFVNLAVRDLARSIDFFRALGFDFNPKFTNEQGACMVLSEHGYVMLLTEPFFRGFTDRQICDTSTHNEALNAISCESRAEVDELMGKVVAAGGQDLDRAQDHGFMYARSFRDLDGHHWEPFWMDPGSHGD